MPYPVYSVQRFNRRTRCVLDTLASGLTMSSASRLAAELREQAPDGDSGFQVATMPLSQQVALLAPDGTTAESTSATAPEAVTAEA